MAQDLWLNLPVKDLAKSVHFFTHLGFKPHPGPGNTAHSASFLVGDKNVVLMLFTQDLFAGFTQHALVDTSQGSEVLFSLGANSRDEVDAFALRAQDAGGRVFAEPRHANDNMYGCGFCDPDGHRWNALFMEIRKEVR
jgi:uncharacterized protein